VSLRCRPAIRLYQKLLNRRRAVTRLRACFCLIPPSCIEMDQTSLSSPSSPLVATPPQVFTSTLPSPRNPELVFFQASPLSSPSQLTRRLPRTRSRPQLSSRASLESIIEESSGENHEHPPTHATSNPTPEFTGGKERTRVTVSRPPSWNGKKGITSGRGMRDVCGIWCVDYSVYPLLAY
jgi:hypothetical protein